MVFHAGCYRCYLGRKGRRVYRGHFGWRRARRSLEVWEVFHVPKSGAEGARGLRRSKAAEGPLFKAYPALVEFLELEEVAGEVRAPGSLLIFSNDMRVKAMIKDIDGGYVAFVSGACVQDVLVAANKVLATGEGDWREDKGAVPRRRKD